jgi:uncharacterized membrane protein
VPGPRVLALADWDNLYSPYLLVGSGLYLLSVPGLAIAYHVPRNDALARVDPESADGARYWARYRSEWTRMNHARVAGGLAAAAVFALALHAG